MSSIRHGLAQLLLIVGLVTPAGCSTIETRRRDWTDYHGPGARYFRLPEPPRPEALPDPAEPANRVAYEFNTGFYRFVVAPLATGYRAVTTTTVRKHVELFRLNLAYPIRLLGTLFQARWSDAGVETSRFLINSTAGLLGCFNPADDWGLPAPRPQDVGRTLGAWGWDEHAYVVVPLVGPSSDRDVVGLAGDTYLQPTTYIFWPLGIFLEFNQRSDQVETYLHLNRTLEDPYAILRDVWTYVRMQAEPVFEHVVEAGPSIDTLEAVYLTYRDAEFPAQGLRGAVTVPATGRALPYDAWLQPEPAPIVYVLPGLGGHRESDSAVALAEMAFDRGCSAVTISSSMNIEFMRLASSVELPGYAPVDAHDVHQVLTAIDADLAARFPGRITQRALLGISLGAFHAFYIAAHEHDPEPLAGTGGSVSAAGAPLLQFDAFVPINPPVRLRYGVEQLDTLYRAPLALPEAERNDRMRNVLLKVLDLARNGLQPGALLPFEHWEAHYLIGLSFRLALRGIVFDSQWRHDRGVLLTPLDPWDRQPAYDEIQDYSWMEYFYAFALPYFCGRQGLGPDPEELWNRCDLRSLREPLLGNNQLRIFTNENDFLLAPEDVAWLQDTFGPERMQFFEWGGHLGNLYRPEIQDAIMAALGEQLRETRAAEAVRVPEALREPEAAH